MKYILIIPARYKSSRLMGKPLIKIDGIPMLIRTVNQCKKAIDPKLIYVATDDKRIERLCKKENVNVIMTSKKCLTGTDRVLDVSKKLYAKTYINVQGDEPVINPEDIKKIISLSQKSNKDILTGYCKISTKKMYRSLNVPKVVFSKNKDLLYASRAPIPSNKLKKFYEANRQVCIYSFPRAILKKFSSNKKTPLERNEDIEYLRFLEKGINIKCIKMSNKSISVDVLSDISEVKKAIKERDL